MFLALCRCRLYLLILLPRVLHCPNKPFVFCVRSLDDSLSGSIQQFDTVFFLKINLQGMLSICHIYEEHGIILST